MRTFEQYCTMTEHALDKAEEALQQEDAPHFNLHIIASERFATLASAMATMATAGRVAVRETKVKPDAGYL